MKQSVCTGGTEMRKKGYRGTRKKKLWHQEFINSE